MDKHADMKKVIIIGAGFAGLNAAKALDHPELDVLIIDKKNHHLFQPLLYQVATAALSPGDIAMPIREVLRSHPNCRVMMGEVEKIDKTKRTVYLQHNQPLSYDYLVIAIGAKHSYFGNETWEAHAPGLKSIPDAIKIREKILVSFEKAERRSLGTDLDKELTFVIIGGGPTGVELAGAIAEIAHKAMLKNFRNIDPGDSKIYLIEAAPRILPMYPEKITYKATQALEKMGVTVITGKPVTEVNKDHVLIGDRVITSSNIIWAAGNQVSGLLQQLDSELDRQGRVKVTKDLSLPDWKEIFVIGDCALATDVLGVPYPALAPVAVQQGRFVAKVIKKYADSTKRPEFRYFDKGSMVIVSKSKALGLIHHWPISGLFAWLVWCFIHILYLIGFRNRLVVLIQWIYAYFSNKRSIRLIYSGIE